MPEDWDLIDEDEGAAMIYHTLIREGMTPDEAQAEVEKIKALPPKPPGRPLTPAEQEESARFMQQHAARILAEAKMRRGS